MESNGYIKLIHRINTLRYQHAVVFSGQKLFQLILRTLIQGDINNISGVVKEKLSTNGIPSKKQFENSFTKDEHDLLALGDHIKWDVSLLFKIIQKVCSLAQCGSSSWNKPTGGQECLEFHIYTLKELRNKLVHDFELVLSEDELDDGLNKLTGLALNMLDALEECAKKQGRNISGNERVETVNLVFQIVDDVRAKINEGASTQAVPESGCSLSASGKVSKNISNNHDEDDVLESDSIQTDNSRLQFDNIIVPDNVYAAAGAGEQLSIDPLLEKVLHDLTRKFWMCAGSKVSVC